MEENKTFREEIYDLTKGRCAYCGKKLRGKWHVTSIDASTIRASCSRCNLWKKGHSLETFRDRIANQHKVLMRDAPGYRLAFEMGVVTRVKGRPIFYFEMMQVPEGEPDE